MPIHVLELNPMTGPMEVKVVVAKADHPDKLKQLLTDLRVEPYAEQGPDLYNPGQEKNYNKVYRKGSVLEGFNPPDDLDKAIFEVMTEAEIEAEYTAHHEKALENILTQYRENMSRAYDVSAVYAVPEQKDVPND